MKPVGSLSLGRKLPSAGSLLVGILVGLLVASVSRAMHRNADTDTVPSCCAVEM